jgi:hypothetical protein
MIDDIVKFLLTDERMTIGCSRARVGSTILRRPASSHARPAAAPRGPLPRRRFGMLGSLRNAWRSLMARQPLDVLDVISEEDVARIESPSTAQ